jgi:hypothetical protein
MLTDQNTKDFISLCKTKENKKELETIINSIVDLAVIDVAPKKTRKDVLV